MYRLIFFFILSFLLIQKVNSQDGETIFRQSCAACHQIGKGRLVGPDLLDIHKRRDSVWIADFIKSSQSMVKAGDPEAVAIFNEYNQIVMPDNTHLSDADIQALLGYMRTAGSSTTATTASPASQRPPAPRARHAQPVQAEDGRPVRTIVPETAEQRSQRLTQKFYRDVVYGLFILTFLFTILILITLKHKVR
jgi:cytochrome c551/c552